MPKNPRSLCLARAFRILLVAGLPLGAARAGSQPQVNSHEVGPDASLTLRYYAPTASAVTVKLDYDLHEIALNKGGDGVWVLKTAPLEPALHMYGLSVDGVPILDPLNRDVDFSYGYLTNTVWVHGKDPQLWDVARVPHGVIHHHAYPSSIIKGLPDGTEDYYVYTPPGYDAASSSTYPVLVLLHGWSARAASWMDDGQANVILDNLIAQGRARPMIVVMPTGYGEMAFVTNGFGVWNDEAAVAHNLSLFGSALLTEILPQVDGAYRTSRNRADRAIAGLSMGGGESLVIGLNHLDSFAWIGGFSSAMTYRSFDPVFPNLGAQAAPQIKLLWIACGAQDDLAAGNRRFADWLRLKGIAPVAVETPGIHNWPVWRDNLIHFAPLLFKADPSGAPAKAP